MKSITALILVALPLVQAAEVNPIQKVLQLLTDTQGKVIAEGDEAQKLYDAKSEFCEERSRNLAFEIKTGKANVAEQESGIAENQASITSLGSKIEDLSGDISSDEAELKAATNIRDKEAADFSAEEAELTQVIDSLERAVSILTKEMAKSGASMLQLKSVDSVTQALTVMVQASALSSDDASRLTSLVQTQQAADAEDSDSDSETGSPAASTYDGHSDGIIGVLEGLLDKSQSQLDKARKTEKTAAQNYKLLKQSLADEMKFANRDMDEAKANLAASTESKAVGEGDKASTSEDLKADKKAKEELHHECMTAAQEFEAGVRSRGEELAALAQAKKVIQESTGGATGQTYGLNQVSFVQVTSKLHSGADLALFQAVRSIRNLAKKDHSANLALLASKMKSAVRLGVSSGAMPFAKVTSLIKGMLSKLQEEADADATKNAYCNKETTETASSKDDKTAELEGLNTKIDQKKAHSTKLKEQVTTLQNELSAMAKAQAEAMQLREEENTAYKKNKAELEQGVRGVRMALKVLKEYYATSDKGHEAEEGAGSSIIGLLEVVLSDFSKGVAEVTTEEETAAADYESTSKANAIEKVEKSKAGEFKKKEYKALDKAVADLSTDASGAQTELDAILEYEAKISKECTTKVEPYAETKKRREQEIAGLKDALTALESQTASLLQKSSKHTLRGFRHHMQ